MAEFTFIFSLILAVVAVIFAYQGVKVVPQQTAWVVERLGKFHVVLEPGLNFIIPFIDRVAYRHSLKEIPIRKTSPDSHLLFGAGGCFRIRKQRKAKKIKLQVEILP